MTANHTEFYSKAYFYDVAFRFKEIAKENATLLKVYEKLNQQKPQSFLDIAAGPATNAIRMNQDDGLRVCALDFSSEMVAYGKERAKEARVDLTYLQGDMRNFELQEPVDMAAIFMASTGYLLKNEDMLSHLKSVSRNLRSGGLYVLEMAHPRDVFSIGSSTTTKWEMKDGECTVKVNWGAEGDSYDPIEQVTNVTAKLSYQTPTESGEIVDKCPQREYTYQEMKALVELSGVFEWVETLGAWDLEIPFSNDKKSWRMIPVLRKK